MRGDEQGVAAVELALVSGFLIMLLFAIVQFGMAWNRTQGLHAAAREGARLASIGADQASIADRVRTVQSLFDAADVVVATVPASANPCAGGAGVVEVTASVPPSAEYAIVIPLWGNVEIAYQATGVFRCE